MTKYVCTEASGHCINVGFEIEAEECVRDGKVRLRILKDSASSNLNAGPMFREGESTPIKGCMWTWERAKAKVNNLVNIEVRVAGHKVEALADDVQIIRSHTPMRTKVEYVGNTDSANTSGLHLWFVQVDALFRYPVAKAFWTKPTKRQLRQFKRYVRKCYRK